MKAAAQAPSNIAFIKYWGKKDENLRLPENGSISMNLSGLYTQTSVEFNDTYTDDTVRINGIADKKEAKRVSVHLDRIRSLSGIQTKAHVESRNSFPSGRGLSSSASGFAALTKAAVQAAGLTLSEKEVSILARQGSGSACRSIPDGFVEWVDGDTSDTSYAVSLYPPNYWNICDVVVVTGLGKKEIPTTEGMTTTNTSPFFEVRKQGMKDKIKQVKYALEKKDFELLGELSEREALEMHAIMITGRPSLLYWTEQTLSFMKKVFNWRKEGIQVYFSINTGQDIHLLCEEQTVSKVQQKLSQEDCIQSIVNYPSKGAHVIEEGSI